MADPNLEEFLKQAALRRKQRQSSSQQSSPPAQTVAAPLQAQVVEAEVIEEPIESISRPLSQQEFGTRVHLNVPKQDHLAQQIDQTDERAAQHVHDVFDHNVGSLSASRSQSSQPTPSKSKKKKQKQSQQPAKRRDVTNTTTDVQRAEANEVGTELMQMLRNPSSLKVAFIVNEIFTRKYQ